MQERELGVKEMLEKIQASGWDGRWCISENSTEDYIRQAYYQMMHEMENKATKMIDNLIVDARKRSNRQKKENNVKTKDGR